MFEPIDIEPPTNPKTKQALNRLIIDALDQKFIKTMVAHQDPKLDIVGHITKLGRTTFFYIDHNDEDLVWTITLSISETVDPIREFHYHISDPDFPEQIAEKLKRLTQSCHNQR